MEFIDDNNSRDDGQAYQALDNVTSDQSSPLTLTGNELRQLSPLAAIPHDQLAHRTPEASSENKKAPPKILIASSSPKERSKRERSKKKSPSERNSFSWNSLGPNEEIVLKTCIDAVIREKWPAASRVDEVTKRFLKQVCPILVQDNSQVERLTQELRKAIAQALHKTQG
jgi:hypothetical protein